MTNGMRDDYNARRRAWRAEHREEFNAAVREYRASHQEQVRKYNAAHREQINGYARVWKAAHRDEIRAREHAKNVAAPGWKTAQNRVREAARPPVVYVWMAPDGHAAYVGRGTTRRAALHRSQASWWTPEHLLLTMTLDSEWQAMEYEGKWGGRYQPRHNLDGYRHAQGVRA